MAREKVRRSPEHVEVIYGPERWELLRDLRREAISILEVLESSGFKPYVHGSVARGDVWERSDIDIVIPYAVPSYKLEYALELGNLNIYSRYIVVATPSSTPKAYIVLDSEERRTISFPLFKLKPREYEFYKFGGIIDVEGLRQNSRVMGVDKRLVLIEPTPRGHVEHPVVGYESTVASRLGISVDTVLERVRVLSRRDAVGRTGTFVKYELLSSETFEEALERIARENPFVRENIQ